MESVQEMPQGIEYNLELYEEYKNRFNVLMGKNIDKLSDEEYDSFMKEVYDKAQDLLSKYPDDARKHSFFAILGNSTITEGMDITLGDFPEEDSIAQFIEGLEEKYLKP